jgi:hypothetical protein
MNHGGGEPSLASLIERSAELKRALVDFALSPRFERHLEQFMLEAADPYQELSEGEAIGVIDRFALQHRLPNGKTMLDQFLAPPASSTTRPTGLTSITSTGCCAPCSPTRLSRPAIMADSGIPTVGMPAWAAESSRPTPFPSSMRFGKSPRPPGPSSGRILHQKG